MYHCEYELLTNPKALDPNYRSLIPAFTEEEKARGRERIAKIKERIQEKRAAEAEEYRIRAKKKESIKVATTNKLEKKKVHKKLVPAW